MLQVFDIFLQVLKEQVCVHVSTLCSFDVLDVLCCMFGEKEAAPLSNGTDNSHSDGVLYGYTIVYIYIYILYHTKVRVHQCPKGFS